MPGTHDGAAPGAGVAVRKVADRPLDAMHLCMVGTLCIAVHEAVCIWFDVRRLPSTHQPVPHRDVYYEQASYQYFDV
jgi:hypothetical protein